MLSAIAYFNRHSVTTRYNPLLCVSMCLNTRKQNKRKKKADQAVILAQKSHIVYVNQVQRHVVPCPHKYFDQ